MEIRRVQPSDLAEIVEIHSKAFDGFFLTAMGPKFLMLLYRGFSQPGSGLGLVASGDRGVTGFVAGTKNPQGFFRDLLLRRWWLFGFAAFEGFLRSPMEVTRRCLSATFYRGEVPPSIQGRPALLSSLAVRPDCSGRGIGKALVAAFVSEARKSGCDSVYLLTDKKGNDAVNRFYERCGFQ